MVAGTSPDYFELRDWTVARGAPLSAADVEGGAKVALLGKTVAEKLYGPGADPIGQTIRIKNIPFQVVGLLSPKGQSPGGQDFDDSVYVPETTYISRIQGGMPKYVSGVIMVRAVSKDALPAAQSSIAALLRDRHHLAPGVDDDFSIRNLTEVASARADSTATMTTLLFWIAAISLLVGGIGIMNIMLVSVTERTREIGLRMAVGARPRDVRGQFLVEALTLSIAGGALGVALGVGAARILAAHGWPTLIRPDIVATAVGFSALVGIVFGLYPAHKASRLDPIVALRHE
jgi:putative ABC transport system permease protein